MSVFIGHYIEGEIIHHSINCTLLSAWSCSPLHRHSQTPQSQNFSAFFPRFLLLLSIAGVVSWLWKKNHVGRWDNCDRAATHMCILCMCSAWGWNIENYRNQDCITDTGGTFVARTLASSKRIGTTDSVSSIEAPSSQGCGGCPCTKHSQILYI